jgi:hypothetical protein
MRALRQETVGLIMVAVLVLAYLLARYGGLLPWSVR